MILIVSAIGDLHAHAVIDRLEREFATTAGILHVDHLSASGGVEWNPDLSGRVRIHTGEYIDLDEINTVWWRRIHLEQREFPDSLNEIERDLINNDCRASIVGLLSSCGGIRWISDPNRQRAAENKLVQLREAKRIGMHIPQTLVTNIPATIRRFYEDMQSNCIVKPVSGTRKAHLMTQRVRQASLTFDSSLSMSPAIYQELIDGTVHLRVHVFGRSVTAIRIESNDLDWRGELTDDFTLHQMDSELSTLCISLNAALGIEMSIIDFKLDRDGRPVFLEANPQGQFLFSQGLSGIDLLQEFCSFLTGKDEKANKAVDSTRYRA